jgi:lipid-binding SYLF domain-containing protein
MITCKHVLPALLASVLSAFLVPAALRTASAQTSAAPAETTTLSAAEKDAERKAREQIVAKGLEKLYKAQPDARKAVEQSVGYAVFDVNSVYAILFVGQRGKGMLFDNGTKKQRYMSSRRAGTGPGVGKQRVYQVFIFKTQQALDQFILAGGTGVDVSGSVSTGKGGTVRSFNPSIEVYQVPESGAALQASWGGTVYTVDTQLD